MSEFNPNPGATWEIPEQGPVVCRDLVIPKDGEPTSNGGKPFPFYLADGIVRVEPIGGGFSKVTLTIIAAGVTVEG